MKFLDHILILPKSIWSYLCAFFNSINENLNSNIETTFEEVYDKITICKGCAARRNETCRVCGCNCFVKCELDGDCPLWNADYVSDIYDPLNKEEYTGNIRESVKIIMYNKSRQKGRSGLVGTSNPKIFRYPFIAYTDENYITKKIFIEY